VALVEETIQSRGIDEKPTFLLFVDLNKVYDTVYHEALCAKMEHITIRGRMLEFVGALYASSEICLRIPGYDATVSLSCCDEGFDRDVLFHLYYLIFSMIFMMILGRRGGLHGRWPFLEWMWTQKDSWQVYCLQMIYLVGLAERSVGSEKAGREKERLGSSNVESCAWWVGSRRRRLSRLKWSRFIWQHTLLRFVV